ncbi:MAG: Fic family protein, partial [Leptolyngbya sp.]|nr:Fic family protein [Candidatus Melainabacteria bacterium]
MSENPSRIEPARLEEFPSSVGDLVAEIASKSSALGSSLHPRTSANLAELVRVMNTYYSNLIEGHNTRPVDIQRALAGEFAEDSERRDLQIEAAAHVRVQAKIDRLMDEELLPEPASRKFILWLHQEFYRDASEKTLLIQGTGSSFVMKPGAWRVGSAQNVAVGRHLPPSSDCVEDFMVYFEKRYCFEGMGMSARILSLAAAH